MVERAFKGAHGPCLLVVAAFVAGAALSLLLGLPPGASTRGLQYARSSTAVMAPPELKTRRVNRTQSMTEIDRSCPRFLYVNPETNSGLGNRFVRFSLLTSLALDLGLTPIYEPEGLRSEGVDGAHGNYPWAQDFLRWGDGMLRLADVEKDYKLVRIPFELGKEDFLDTLASTRRDRPICHALYELPSTNFILTIIKARHQPRLYERVQPLAQASLLSVPPHLLPALAFRSLADDYNVVIHIRTGDIRLPSDPSFLRHVKAQLDALLLNQPVHYYFIAEDPQAGDGRPPLGFEYLAEAFQGERVGFLNSLDVRSSLWQMMNADLLVLTGSGFPYIAAVSSWKPVVLHGPNKEGDHELFRHRDWVQLDAQGMVCEPRTLSEVRAKILVKKHLYHGRTLLLH